jgi:uncharacterized membrane protein YfcA
VVRLALGRLFPALCVLRADIACRLITDPYFYYFAIPAVLLTGVSKGGFGGALGGVAVPLMALAISPVQAAVVMLPVLVLMDVFGVRVYLGKWDTANLKIIIPGSMIGIALGALTFGWFSDFAIRIVLGGISILFVLNSWLGVALRQPQCGRSAAKGTFWSSVAGFTSFIAHTGGPPLMFYLLPQRMNKVAYVATINVFFMTTNAVKLFAYSGLGQFTALNLTTSLVLAPFVPIGVWFGLWLQNKVSHVWFYRISQTCLLLTGVQLVCQGIYTGRG